MASESSQFLKPPPGVPIDRSHPIGRSLARLWRFDSTIDADVVRGDRLTPAFDSPAVEMSRYGPAGAVPTGSVHYWTHPAPTDLQGTAAFSVILFHEFTYDPSVFSDYFGQWGTSGTSDAQQVLRRWTGQFDWTVQNAALSFATTSFSGSTFVKHKRYSTIFTADGANLRVYNNGALISGPTALAGPYFASDATTWKIGYGGSVGISIQASGSRWRIVSFGYTNRAISQDQAIELYESPWSFLLVRTPTWYVPLQGEPPSGNVGTGSALGEATATAVSASLSSGAGLADGAALATGVGAAIVQGVGSATAEATASAVGKAIANAVGSALGDASATAVGKAIANAVGSALGEATATAVGTSSSSGSAVGTASGDSSAAATGQAIANVVGVATGDSSAVAVGRAVANAVGSALGEATASAVGTSTNQGVGLGSALGDATATAVGRAVVNAVGTAVGSATAEAAGAGGLTAALRDRPILRHLAQLLRDTGQFHRVTTTGEVERKGESAEHYKFATLSLTGFNEQAWAGDPDEDTVVQRTVTYQVVVAVRDEDPDCRDDELDRLVQVVHNTLGGRSYSDATESEQSHVTGGRYLPAVSPQREVVLTGQWVQMVEDWGQHYATV